MERVGAVHAVGGRFGQCGGPARVGIAQVVAVRVGGAFDGGACERFVFVERDTGRDVTGIRRTVGRGCGGEGVVLADRFIAGGVRAAEPVVIGRARLQAGQGYFMFGADRIAGGIDLRTITGRCAIFYDARSRFGRMELDRHTGTALGIQLDGLVIIFPIEFKFRRGEISLG